MTAADAAWVAGFGAMLGLALAAAAARRGNPVPVPARKRDERTR